MAISALMLFENDGNVCAIYDSVIDEMGVRDNPPRGSIYHWCAPVSAGLQVCDVWQTREDFERFAREKIAPVTAKHGLKEPVVEIAPVHEMIVGRTTAHKGLGLFVDFHGDTNELLQKIDKANEIMNAMSRPPEGLVFHWTIGTSTGVRAIDQWRSQDDFDYFLGGKLGEAARLVSLPQPRVTHFEVYNTIDPRVVAHV